MAARKTKRFKKRDKVVGLQDVKKLWKAVSAKEWLVLFNEIAPEYGWKLKGHNQIISRCPYHDESTPSFVLSFNKAMGKCFGSCGKYVGNIEKLVADLLKVQKTEALIFLHNRFGLDDLLSCTIDELTHFNQVQEMKKATATAMNSIIQEVLRDKPKRLKYCEPAVEYLLSVRNIPMEALPSIPVGVFAKPEHLKKYIPSKLHNLFEEYFTKYNNPQLWGSVSFHYNDSPGTISKFKLRVIHPEIINKTRSEIEVPKENWITKDFVYIEDPFTQKIGIYGLHRYQRMIGKNDTNAYVTEGEFDVLSVMSRQVIQGATDFMILGCGGKGSTDIGFLREYGIKTVWLVQDHPAKNGDSWALSILGTKNNFTQTLDHRPLMVKVFQWPMELQGTDLDEVVKLNGYEEVVNYLFRKRNSYFVNSHPWIITKCEEELEKSKKVYDVALHNLDQEKDTYLVEKTNLLDERSTRIKEVLIQWFKYIHEQSDRVDYIQKFHASEGIDISQVADVNKQVYALDTMEGVVAKVKEAFAEYFSVAFYERKSTGNTVYLWSKTREELVEYNPVEKSVFSLISIYMGHTITDWFDSLLGNNEIYLNGTSDLTPFEVNQTKRRNAYNILQQVVETMLGQSINIVDLTSFSQGIHFIDLPDKIKNKGIVYFVNGKHIFKGTFKGPDMIDWEHIDNVVDEQSVLFENLSRTEEWSSVKDTADLDMANMIDLKDVYRRLKVIIDGWKFEHHDIISEYLVSYIMSISVTRAVGNINITWVSGDKESGKSSLINGLMGDSRNNTSSVPSVVESSFVSSDSTTAAMYQSMHGSSLLYVIDEAESTAKYTSSSDDRTRDLIRMIYGMPQGTIVIRRGSPVKGQQVTYQMRMPVLMAAINLPSDSAFISRIMTIYTVKDPGRQDLGDYIYERFTREQLDQLKKEVTLGLIPKIPEIIKKRNELKNELSKLRGVVAHVSNRFLDSILTPLAVYSLIGKDAKKLYTEILIRYKDRLESIHSQDKQSDVLNACLYTEAIKVSSEDTMTDYVSAKHLIYQGEFHRLNNSDSGVYYDEQSRKIILVWRQIKYSIFKRLRYMYEEESSLRAAASKNPYVVPEITVEEHEQLVNRLCLQDVSSSAEYTVLDIGYLVRGDDDNGGDIPDADEVPSSKVATKTRDKKADKEKAAKRAGEKRKSGIRKGSSDDERRDDERVSGEFKRRGRASKGYGYNDDDSGLPEKNTAVRPTDGKRIVLDKMDNILLQDENDSGEGFTL